MSAEIILAHDGAEPAMDPLRSAALPVLAIRPAPGWRDIQVRYKQTVLGAAWAVIQPVMMMLVFSLFFGRLGGLDQRTGRISYPVFAFCALVPWQLFSYALTQASNSVVNEQRLLTKVY